MTTCREPTGCYWPEPAAQAFRAIISAADPTRPFTIGPLSIEKGSFRLARYRYIEFHEGETWKDLSGLFFNWISANKPDGSFGFSEGDALEVNDGLRLYCFAIPNKHGSKVNWFEEWAQTTGRLYGAEAERRVTFPDKPELVVTLPPRDEMVLPSWMQDGWYKK